jgi:RimJ/RimL family protein N-acetyltransferase
MRDKKITFRAAKICDCEDVYNWRSDPTSRSMSFNTAIQTYEDHKNWFKASLNDADRKLFIGEIDTTKIGVCRFDRYNKTSYVEVSINMNPESRGCGFGKKFLALSVEYFQKTQPMDLLARIKPENEASLQIFKSLGFEEISSKAGVIKLMKCEKSITFKEVDEKDTDLLFDLLAQRRHSISHKRTPSLNEHKAFVKTHPYRHWAVIFRDNYAIGTLYIQEDNSVGLNTNEPSLYVVSKVLAYIRRNFQPLKEIKSKRPHHFYLNTPYDNEELGEALLNSDALPIQISFRI